MNLTAKEDTGKLEMQCQCNTSFAVAYCNDDKQQCNSSITNHSSATDVLA